MRRSRIIIIILSLSPIVTWSLMQPLSSRWINFNIVLQSIGQITGLVGIMIFSLSFILSTRIKFLENIFGGLDKIYVLHHKLGKVALILLIIHPLFLALARNISFQSKIATDNIIRITLFFLPGSDWTINLGIASLFFMIALLILTLYVNLKYHKWLFTHKFLGFAYIVGGLHSFFVSSDISRNEILKYYMLVFYLAGLLAFFYKTIFGRFLVKKLKYRVLNLIILNDNVVEISLITDHEKLRFIPGQFCYVSFFQKGISPESHPFSITSSPNEKKLTLLIKNEGDFTSELRKIKIDTKCLVEGAYGRFICINSKFKKQVWIAGGIGIAPFLSMIEILETSEYEVDFYYCFHGPEDAIYLDVLSRVDRAFDTFRLFPICSQTQGRLKVSSIEAKSGNLKEREIFICGPPKMTADLINQFKKLGISNSNIHSELF